MSNCRKISDLRKGEYFVFVNSRSKCVYLYEGYDRSARKYGYSKADDYNTYYTTTGDKIVNPDITY